MSITAQLLGVFLGGVFAFAGVFILVGMLSGKITTKGLLASPESSYDPERLMLLIATFIGAAYYASITLPLLEQKNITALPDVPEELLYLLGSSQLAYLTGKRIRKDLP